MTNLPIPPRKPFHAHRLVRLLTKTAAAMRLGSDAFVLVVTIAHQEDSIRYTQAIAYWGPQLCAILGFGSHDRLERARKRAIDAGWLGYTPGRKSVAALYWTQIPAEYSALDDQCSAENGKDYGSTGNSDIAPAIPTPEMRKQIDPVKPESSAPAREQTGSKPPESAEHSSLSLSLSQERGEKRARARSFLDSLLVPSKGKWLAKWGMVARQYGAAEGTTEIQECLRWAIRKARERERVVNYPEHITKEAIEWRQTQRESFRQWRASQRQPDPTPNADPPP